MKNHAVRFMPLLAILLLAAALRLPAFFQPPWYMDEGIFAFVGNGWRSGGALYTDVWDNKPPGIFAVYALAWSSGLEMLAVRLLDLAAMLGTIVLVYAIARRFTGDVAGFVAASLTAVLLGLPTIEGYIANTESFLILFTTAGMYLLLHAYDARPRATVFVAAGLALGAACMFKQVGAFDVAAAAAFLAIAYRRDAVRPLVMLGAGVAVLPLTALVLFGVFGSVDDLVFSTVTSLAGYREDSTDTGPERFLVALIPLAIALPYAAWRRPWQAHAPDVLFVLWLAFTALAVTASGRAYPHYLLQMVPPVALVAATLVSSHRPRLPRAIAALGQLTAVVVLANVILGPLPNLAWNREPDFTRGYYANFLDYALGDIDREEHDAFFGSRAHAHLGLYDQLDQAGLRSEKVFVWGDVPWLYTEAGLRAVTPYATLFNAVEVEGDHDAVAALLLDHEPPYILVMAETRASWDAVQPVLAERYVELRTLEFAVLYGRR